MKMRNILLKIILTGVLIFGVIACQSVQTKNSYTAKVDETGVWVDGKQFRILSGEIHYFRVQPEQWRDRLEKLRACGLNSVSVYMPWNLHQPQPDQFCFEGMANIGGFLDICQELGIKVLLRPAPYICSEWDFGGLPAWLLKDKNISIRSFDEKYISAIKTYYKRLFKEIVPYYCNNGGPIIAIQLENEYSNFGDDEKYIRFLKQQFDDSGFKGILYMAEGSPIYATVPLKIEGVWTTATTFPIKSTYEMMKKIRPNLPVMISELWCGQGYRLGIPLGIIRKQNVPHTLAELDEFLANGGHVNLYMFHGGKTYGFMNGAVSSSKSPYIPFVSSYDADTLLNEAGDPTEKYHLYRKIFLKYNPSASKYKVPVASKKIAYNDVVFTESAKLSDNFKSMVAKTVQSQNILSMEDMGYYYGMINYKTTIPPQQKSEKVKIQGLKDRAWVYFNGKHIGTFTQNDKEEPLFAIPQEGGKLEILVENMGRLNSSFAMVNGRRGIESVLVRKKYHFGWEISSLPFENMNSLNWKSVSAENKNSKHTFFKGEFNVDEIADTYINFDNFTRGYVWVNGVHLGRYDCLPPVYTTYIPKEILKKGKNKIEIFELEGAKEFSAKFSKYPIYQIKDKRVIMK